MKLVMSLISHFAARGFIAYQSRFAAFRKTDQKFLFLATLLMMYQHKAMTGTKLGGHYLKERH